ELEVVQTVSHVVPQVDQDHRARETGQKRVEVRGRSSLEPTDRTVLQSGPELPGPLAQPLMNDDGNTRQGGSLRKRMRKPIRILPFECIGSIACGKARF